MVIPVLQIYAKVDYVRRHRHRQEHREKVGRHAVCFVIQLERVKQPHSTNVCTELYAAAERWLGGR